VNSCAPKWQAVPAPLLTPIDLVSMYHEEGN
jgi:hypothetical protein